MPAIEEWKRGRRFNTALNVVMANGEDHYVGETKNVSDTGLCLLPKADFPVGTQLHLVFGRPPELPPLTAQGIVRWSEDGKGVGVQFTSMSLNDQQALLRFVMAQPHREQV